MLIGMRPVGDWAEVHMVLKGLLDLDAEIGKLEKSIDSKTVELKKIAEAIAAPSWDKVGSFFFLCMCAFVGAENGWAGRSNRSKTLYLKRCLKRSLSLLGRS